MLELTEFARGTAWGIVPAKFEVLARQIAEMKGADLEARIAQYRGRSEDDEDLYAVTDNGVAVITINGPLSKRGSFYSWYMGMANYATLGKAFRKALADPAVSSIVFDIDSPGGVVNGVEALAGEIYAARGQKPILAYANGLMASAAYWLGSAADKIIASKTADIGSIGVLMIHLDYSQWDAKVGIKTTYLTAGKFKAIGNDAEPLSQEAREVFQDELDYLYGIFTGDIARNRGASEEDVRSNMADGKVFIGAQAKEVGLIDGVGTLEEVLESAAELGEKVVNKRSTLKRRVSKMDRTEFKAENPELFDEIIKEGAASVDQDKIKTDATAAEQERLVSLVEAVFGEDQSKQFKAIVDSGADAKQVEALRGVLGTQGKPDDGKDADAAEKALAALKKSGAGDDAGAGEGNGAEGADFMSLVDAYKTEKGVSKAEAIKHCMAYNKKEHAAYLKAVN